VCEGCVGAFYALLGLGATKKRDRAVLRGQSQWEAAYGSKGGGIQHTKWIYLSWREVEKADEVFKEIFNSNWKL